jgi:hypothetical protein
MHAQVGINTETPNASALVDMVSTDKGLLAPRVNLTSNTFDLDGIPGQAEGLFVYNIGAGMAKGYYFWNGVEWRSIDESSSSLPEIESLPANSSTLEPTQFKAGIAYKGILRVYYTGGNGGKYGLGSPIASSGNTGLTATLKPGKLEYGSGYLIYDVVGTPIASSPTAAKFVIRFGSTTERVRLVTVGDIVSADIKNIATLGTLVATSENTANGFHRVITTPDGKFSVRVFVPNNSQLQAADIQIRSNSGTPTLMWNSIFGWPGGISAQATNAFRLPLVDMWYGNNGDNAVAVSTNANAAWGDPDVYYNAPEQRSYMWTTTDVNDKTSYVLSFMMGAPSPSLLANATNVAQTKAFLKIEQINSPE